MKNDYILGQIGSLTRVSNAPLYSLKIKPELQRILFIFIIQSVRAQSTDFVNGLVS